MNTKNAKATKSTPAATVTPAPAALGPIEREPSGPRQLLTKMEEAGRKAAAKAKATERASFALIFASEYGGPEKLAATWDAMKSEEWAGLAIARAVREAESSKSPALEPLSALLAKEKPRAGVVVAGGVVSAKIKETKGSRYIIVRILADDDVGEVDQEVKIVREAGKITITK